MIRFKQIFGTIMAVVLGSGFAFGQCTAFQPSLNVEIANIVTAPGEVTFDIMLKSNLAQAAACGVFHLGNADFTIEFDDAAFTNPAVSLVGSGAGSCTLVPTDSTEVVELFPGFFVPRAALFQNAVYGALSVNLADSDGDMDFAIRLLYNGPTPSDAASFNDNVAVILDDAGIPRHRLAVVNISGHNGADPGLTVINLDNGLGGAPPAAAGSGDDEILAELNTKAFFINSSDPFVSVQSSITSISTPLPVKLTKFEANKYNRNSSVVIWQTATEYNTSHFEIQRAEKGGESWTQIGEVKAEGNSTSLQSYQFVDYDVYDGKRASADFMYRLKVIDLDGKYDYSNIDEVNFGKALREGTIKTFPNPAKDGVHIQFSSDLQQKPTEVQVYDIVGKLVYSQDIAEDADYAYIDFLVAKVESGSYMVQFMANNLLIGQEKIIVQQ
jgi:hypothetical protein